MDDGPKHFLELEEDELLGFLHARINHFFRFLENSGQLKRIRDLYLMYHGFDRSTGEHATSDVIFDGERGEVTLLRSNQIRNLLQHVLALTTSQRPSFEPVAANQSYEAYESVGLARDILQYYSHETERLLKKAAEYSWVTSEGYLLVEWDAFGGRDTASGEVIGDFAFTPLTSLDVIRDPLKPYEDQQYFIVRKKVNRFDLAAQFPEHAEHIKNLGLTNDSMIERRFEDIAGTGYFELGEDDVYVYTLYHERTSAVPQGAMLMFVDERIILEPQPLPYRRVPLLREVPGEFLTTSLGYSPGFDLIGLQEGYDSLLSTALTNLTAYGVQMWLAADNSITDFVNLEKGLGVVTYKAGTQPPQPVQMASVAKELFVLSDLFKSEVELLSGVNSVVRGQPTDNIRSGSAAALMNANAVQFASKFVESHTLLMEQLATIILEILQDYADNERIITVTGPGNSSAIKRFTGGELKDIRKVFVKVGSPLMSTLSGRQQVAEQLVQMGADPRMYMEVLETGRLEPITGPNHSQYMLMVRENEAMRKGETPSVLKTDIHPQHIAHHRMELDHPDVRKDPARVQAVLGHISQHFEVWRNTDGNELLAMGMQPLQPIPPEQQAPQPPQGEGGQPAALANGAPPGPEGQPGRPSGQLPNMPEPADVPTQ